MFEENKYELIVKLKRKKKLYSFKCKTKEEVVQTYSRIKRKYGSMIKYRKVKRLKSKWNGIMEAVTADGYTFRGDKQGLTIERAGRSSEISWRKFSMLVRESPAIVDWSRVVAFFIKRPRLFKDVLVKGVDIVNTIKLKQNKKVRSIEKIEEAKELMKELVPEAEVLCAT